MRWRGFFNPLTIQFVEQIEPGQTPNGAEGNYIYLRKITLQDIRVIRMMVKMQVQDKTLICLLSKCFSFSVNNLISQHNVLQHNLANKQLPNIKVTQPEIEIYTLPRRCQVLFLPQEQAHLSPCRLEIWLVLFLLLVTEIKIKRVREAILCFAALPHCYRINSAESKEVPLTLWRHS
jgi:hypothetical protein